MKWIAATSLAVAMLSGGMAKAADLGAPVIPYVATAEAFDWNGLYFGVNGGGAWGDSNWTASFFGTSISTGDFDTSGGLAGFTLGYDWQNGPAVLGGVADFDWADIAGDTPGSGVGSCFPNCATASDWLATVRARFGFAHGPFLAYATGGLAVGDVTSYHKTKSSGSSSSTETGWTAGAGIEYAFLPGWSTWLEYLYADLGSSTCKAGVCAAVPTTVDFKTSIVRAGINKRW